MTRTREEIRKYHLAWSERNRERCREYSNRSYQKHKDEIWKRRLSDPNYRERAKQAAKEWSERNPERKKENQRRWLDRNRERMRQYRIAYGPRRRELYQVNREHILERKRMLGPKYRWRVQGYQQRHRRESIQFCLAERLRATMRRALSRNFVEKSKRTFQLIGCTPIELKSYIEKQFKEGMTWENRRLWHIDHIRPIASFDLTKPEEQAACFHYTNLQPLWAWENHRKSDKYEPKVI